MTMHVSSELLAQARTIAAQSIRPGRPPATIAELITRYLTTHCADWYRKNEEPTTQVHVIRAATARLQAVAGDRPPATMDPLTLEHARQVMVLQGLGRETCNKYAAAIVQMFEWASVREFCPADLPERLKLLPGLRRGRTPAPDTEPKKPVPALQLKATLRSLRRAQRSPAPTSGGDPGSDSKTAEAARMLWTMIALQLRTGMRPAELCAMEWLHLDTDGAIWVYQVPQHINKTQHHGIERKVFIGPDAQRWMLDWTLRGGTSGGRLFSLKRNSYRQKLKRWLATAGIPHWHPNQLRHNFATAIDRVDDEKAAKILLGHTHVRTTRGYIDPDTRRAMDLIRRIG